MLFSSLQFPFQSPMENNKFSPNRLTRLMQEITAAVDSIDGENSRKRERKEIIKITMIMITITERETMENGRRIERERMLKFMIGRKRIYRYKPYSFAWYSHARVRINFQERMVARVSHPRWMKYTLTSIPWSKWTGDSQPLHLKLYTHSRKIFIYIYFADHYLLQPFFSLRFDLSVPQSGDTIQHNGCNQHFYTNF